MTDPAPFDPAQRRIAELEREVGRLRGEVRLLRWRLSLRQAWRRRLLQPAAQLKRRLSR